MELSTRKPTSPLSRGLTFYSLFFFLIVAGCASTGGRKPGPLTSDEAETLMRSNDCEFEEVTVRTEPAEMLRQLLERETVGRLRADQFSFLMERALCPGREGPPDYVQVAQNYRVHPVSKTDSYSEFRVEYDWIGTLLPLTEDDRTEIKWEPQTGTYARTVRFYRTSMGWKVESSYFADGEFLPASVVLTQYNSRLPADLKKRLESLL